MIRLRYFWILALSMMVIFNSCKDEEPQQATLNLKITPVSNGAPIAMNTPFTLSNGVRVQLSSVYFYLSDLQLINDNGSSSYLQEISIYDLEVDEKIAYNVDGGSFTNISFGLGVKETLNHEDPATFENDHPLGFNNSSNNWGWDNGYIFYTIEGQYDLDNDGTFDGPLLYHVGKDDLYKSVLINREFAVSSVGETELELFIDFNKVFLNTGNQIDFTTENVTHSSGDGFALANKINNNVIASFE